MDDTRSFDDVTPAIWQRVKEVGRRSYGTVFEPPDEDAGTARTMTPFGVLELDFVLDRVGNRITYTVRRKPFLLLSGPLWQGLEGTIERCRNEVQGT
jgi:hypothetical protein